MTAQQEASVADERVEAIVRIIDANMKGHTKDGTRLFRLGHQWLDAPPASASPEPAAPLPLPLSREAAEEWLTKCTFKSFNLEVTAAYETVVRAHDLLATVAELRAQMTANFAAHGATMAAHHKLREEAEARAEKAEARQREAEAIRDRMAVDLNDAQTKIARQSMALSNCELRAKKAEAERDINAKSAAAYIRERDEARAEEAVALEYVDDMDELLLERWNEGQTARKDRDYWRDATQDAAAQITRLTAALAEMREACARVAEKWTNSGHIRLHAGEMTAQELRSVKAVVGAIVSGCRALPLPVAAEEEKP